MEQDIEKLLSALEDIVAADSSWREKYNEIIRIAKANDRWDMALEEFMTWIMQIEQEKEDEVKG